ncbi:MAG: putative DNA binding domain-containing protein [Limnochordia bacterium]|nr:putative DNA binding domain-containing protein [Limnochordia bacterium]
MKYAEDQRTELKEIINADFKKEIVALANTEGGEIYVGVAKDGRVIGVDNPEREMERIGNMIRDGIKPDLAPYTTIESFKDEGRELIRVIVSRGLKRPYHVSDKGLKPSGVFVRHGVSSIPATDEAIRQMIKESDGSVFDKMRSLNQELTFVYGAKYFSDREIPFRESKQRTLGFVDDDGYFTNAGLLLSDQCGHIVRCAVYEGTGKTNFKTRREFSGSILKQIDDAYEFLQLNNNLRSTYDGLRRIDHADYPLEALREALLNAVVHRDYDYSGSIIINIFDNRMEFISLGGLVKGLTLTDIFAGVSQPRNAVIANVFYRLELIEAYGTGIQKIMESYAHSATKPIFKPGPASFVVTLPNRNESDEIAYDPSLTREENIFLLMSKKEKVTRKDVEHFLGCSAFPAGEALKSLVEKNKVVRIGAGRGTQYMLKKS